jgi:hypothetical protein
MIKARHDSLASRFQLPLLGSNQDSPDPESPILGTEFRQNVVKLRVRVVRVGRGLTAYRPLDDELFSIEEVTE